MFGQINTLARIIALAASVPLVLGSVLPHAQEMELSILRRGETWEQYDQTSVAFAQQGLCRLYRDKPTRPGVDGLWPCRQFCHSNSFICIGDKSGDAAAVSRNPDGQQYLLAECQCDTRLPEAIALAVLEGLKELDNITCAVWLQALKEAVFVGAWIIPGGAEAGAAAKASLKIIKSIKTFDKLGGKSAWVDFVESTCDVENWDVVDKAFNLGTLVKSL